MGDLVVRYYPGDSFTPTCHFLLDSEDSARELHLGLHCPQERVVERRAVRYHDVRVASARRVWPCCVRKQCV